MKGNKKDRKDAKWICDLFMCGMVKPSFIPPEDIRQLRDLMRYRRKLTSMDLLSSVKTRYVDFGDSGPPREMLSNINTPEDYARITGDL